MSTLIIPRLNSDDERRDDILKILLPTIIEEGLQVVKGSATGPENEKITLVLPSIVNKIKTTPNSGIEVTSTNGDGTGEVHIRLRLDNVRVNIKGVVDEFELNTRRYKLSFTPIENTLKMYISGLKYSEYVDFTVDNGIVTINNDIELDGEPIFFEYLVTG